MYWSDLNTNIGNVIKPVMSATRPYASPNIVSEMNEGL
jgi:hypothetical protein